VKKCPICGAEFIVKGDEISCPNCGKMLKKSFDISVLEPKTAEDKKKLEDERAVVFRITAPETDLRGDVVETKGADLSIYKKNPVFLWAHDHSIPAIGRAMWTKKGENNSEILSKVQFQDTTQLAKDVYELYRQGFLKACSIGFLPKAGGIEDIVSEDETDKGKVTGYRFNKWYLLETSGCNVPCLSSALAKSIVVSDRLKKDFKIEPENNEEKTIGGNRNLALAPEDRDWNATRAERSVREWAGGEEIDWNKYKQAFVYFDPENRETFGGYKLPLWRGVAAGMAVLLGARGGVDMPAGEKKQAYNFFVSYYKKFDKEPPEFREYTEDELKGIFPELYEDNTPDTVNKPTWDETENEIRFRIKNPDLFDTFRYKTIVKEKPRVFGVYAKYKGKDEWAWQALRFPKADGWTTDKAKAWLADHPELTKEFLADEIKDSVILDAKELGPVTIEDAIADLSKSVKERFDGIEERLSKIEQKKPAEEPEPQEPEKDEGLEVAGLEIVNEPKKEDNMDNSNDSPEPDAPEETELTLDEARKIVPDIVKNVIGKTLAYMRGETFEPK